MHETSLQRPLIVARTRRALVVASVLTGLVFASGILVGATLYNAPRIERISAPAARVTVDVPQVPPPAVSIHVQPPTTPEPPAANNPPPSKPAIPRPRVPHLWPQCVLVSADTVDGACTWDDGFPAISSDGALIASKYVPDDSGRGYPGLSIRFIDATSGKEVKTIVVLSPDEYIENDGTNTKEFERLQKTVASRLAEVERALDDGAYRTMAHLVEGGPFDGTHEESEAAAPTAIYGQIDQSGAARIIDPATNTVIWQHQLGIDDPSPITDDDDGGMCPGWGLRMMSLWWDPTTRVVFSTQEYRTGGCMCSDETYEQVARVP